MKCGLQSRDRRQKKVARELRQRRAVALVIAAAGSGFRIRPELVSDIYSAQRLDYGHSNILSVFVLLSINTRRIVTCLPSCIQL